MTTTSSAEAGLAGMRAELDLIDAQLLDTLKTRIDICVRIAEFKREHDVPMMQPHRIGIVQERAAASEPSTASTARSCAACTT
jgi:chorismate mutase-like protein